MDILSDILDHLNLKASLYFRTDLAAPWGINVPEYRNVARFHIVFTEGFWLKTEKDENIKINPGDIVFIPRGKAHSLRDQPESKVHNLNDIIERAEYKAGELLKYGEGSGKRTKLICGHLEFEDQNLHPLLSSFPDYIHIKHSNKNNLSWLNIALDFIDFESIHREPGATSMINRLSEVMFIQTLRYYMKNSPTDTLFLAALNDRYIRKSIEEIHNNPRKKWKLNDLAKVSGLSRTIYAERFNKLTGTTPIHYLTQWRVEKAKKFLKNESISIDDVALQVGYSAGTSFQKTFKKLTGLTPSAYRKSMH